MSMQYNNLNFTKTKTRQIKLISSNGGLLSDAYYLTCSKAITQTNTPVDSDVEKLIDSDPMARILFDNDTQLFDRYVDCRVRWLVFSCPNCAEKGIKKIRYSCNLMFCNRCAKKRQNRLYRRYKEGIKGPNWRVITLTCGRIEGFDRQTLPFWREKVQRFLKRSLKVRKYISVAEIIPKTGYLHFHILADCQYIPQNVLSHKWEKYSNMKVVYIQKMKSLGALNYILKYFSKPMDGTPQDLYRYFGILKNQRRVSVSLHFCDDQEKFIHECPCCGETMEYVGFEFNWSFFQPN